MPPQLLRLLLVVAVLLAVSGGDSTAADAAAGADAYDASLCHKSFRCGDHDIHYPFYLFNESRSYCGYPGMAILCDDSRATATLRLEGNASYTVLAIDYPNHTVTVADADVLRDTTGCPRPRRNVTIPAYAWLNFTATGNSTISFFLDCSFTLANPPPLDIIPINCTGFSSQGLRPSSFLATEPGVLDADWLRASACREVFVAPVLATEWLLRPEYRPRLGSGGYGEVLRRGFRLSWDPSKGPCYECEANGGQCGYDQFGGFQGCLCSDGRVRQDCGQTPQSQSQPQPQPDPDADFFRYTNCAPTLYQCGELNFPVDYPFVVDGLPRPDYCSAPGHRLFCANGTTLTISMNSSSGPFQVTGVDYLNRVLTVVDQSLAHDRDSCMQRRRNTTIDAAAFAYTDRDRFLTAYVNCSATSSSLPLVYDLFSCVTGGRSYYRMDNGTVAADVLGVCSSTLVVPYDAAMADALAAGNASLGDAVRGGFSVRWRAGAGWCDECQASGGRCGHDGRAPDDHICFCPDGQAVGSCPSGSESKKPNRKTIIAIGTSVAALVMFLLLVVVSFLYIRKRRLYEGTPRSRLLQYTMSGGTPRSRGSNEMDYSGSVHHLPTHHFSYEELEDATGGFSDTRELGDGGFGAVYKGQLRDGRVVAVKRLYNNGCRQVEQFVNEAAILSRLRHPNLVTFYGCTSSRSRELLLVYEYVPNGTVADHLHGHRSAEHALSWQLRLSIGVEAATALAYLHAIEPPVVHRDVKTNNILLDADFHVKVADFGLSRLLPLDGAMHVSTTPQGTPGYVDPEYHRCYQLTDKSDVYSFGVVLAELISSKPAVDITRDRDEINLAGMAVGRIQRSQVDQLVDLDLGYGSDETTRRAMTMVAELAFRCLQQNGEMRPPIREVLDVLVSIQEDGGAKEEDRGGKKPKDGVHVPRSPDTVHAPWDSLSTTPSISQ